MTISHQDREILRGLAAQVAEIAALPIQEETRNLWKALNGLKPIRPMVLIDQIPWHEMDHEGELVLRTEDEFCGNLETELRRRLYTWKHMRADMVMEPFLDLPKVIRGADFGISAKEELAVTDPRNDVVGHRYFDQLRSEEDLQKIRPPQVILDVAATARTEQIAQEIFDGLLSVRMHGIFPWANLWDWIIEWRGVEDVLLDLLDRPAFIHALMMRITDFQLDLVDQLEALGLLGCGQTTIHCSGAYTDELPAPGFDSAHPRAKDLWISGMAQIFATVSPAMHQEFELNYANRLYDRFGLVYYGCCEPLHAKIGVVEKIPHLRKISISPWADVERSAREIGGRFVVSRKPNPAFLAGPSWDPGIAEADLRETLRYCQLYGSPVEFILKDISTVCYEPKRLWEWADLAMRIVTAG